MLINARFLYKSMTWTETETEVSLSFTGGEAGIYLPEDGWHQRLIW